MGICGHSNIHAPGKINILRIIVLKRQTIHEKSMNVTAIFASVIVWRHFFTTRMY